MCKMVMYGTIEEASTWGLPAPPKPESVRNIFYYPMPVRVDLSDKLFKLVLIPVIILGLIAVILALKK